MVSRSNVEYAALVWGAYYCTHINRLEAVQHKFLICSAYKLWVGVNNYNYDYADLCSRFCRVCRTEELN